jgi:hypothetical protein
MVKKWVAFLVVIVLAGGGYYYYRTHLCSSFLSKESIKLNGVDMPVQTKAGVKERGLRLRLIPDGRNAAIGYVKASNLYRKPGGSDEALLVQIAANAWVDDRNFVHWFARNEKCLAVLHEATRKPDCQFPYFGKESDSLAELPLPHLSTMMDFTRLLVCEGKRCEHEGNHSKALDCYLAASRVAEHLNKSDSFAIAKFHVISCHSIANNAVEGCVASGKLSEDDLRKAVDHYRDGFARCPQLADALEAEHASGDNLIKALERRPSDAARLFPNITSPDQVRGLVELVRRDADGIRARRDRVWGELKQWCALPAWEAFRPGRDWDAYLRSLPPTYVFPRVLTGAFGQMSRGFVKCQAELGGVAIFAAIKLYEKKNGRPPSSLGQLTGDYISKLPKDPFSGRDYVYKVSGSEWILYSVSDDLADNGGAGRMPHDYAKDKDLVFWSGPIPVAAAPR